MQRAKSLYDLKREAGRATTTRPSNGQRGYDWQWQKFRRELFASQPMMCLDCRRAGRVRLATELHHIAKLSDDPERQYDLDNLMPLCRSCHAIRTRRGE